MTESLQEFYDKFMNSYEYTVHKMEAPTPVLDILKPKERRIAENELISKLSLRDDWPIIGLGYLRSKKAKDKLYDMLPKASGDIKAKIAVAIYKICKDETMIDIVIFLSYIDHGYYHEHILIDIIHCLSEFKCEETSDRLKELEDDPNYLISYHAKRALKLGLR